MKKITAISLVLLLLAGIGHVLPAAAAEVGKNLLKNPGFELDDANGYNANWAARRASTQSSSENSWKDNPYISLDEEIFHKGERSVKMTRSTDETLFVYQDVAVLPHTRYQINFWVRSDTVLDNDAKPLRFKVEYYTGTAIAANVNPVDDSVHTSSFAPTAAETWEYKSGTIVPPAQTKTARFYCMLSRNATVWIDDLEVIQTEEEKKLELRADQYFYYPEVETGYAQARVYDSFVETYAAGTVDFTLYDTDGTTELQSRTGCVLTDGIATFDFPISFLSAKKKSAFILKAELKDSGGNTVDTSTREVYCYDRPTDMNADGQLLNADGTVFEGTLGYGTNKGDSLLYDELKSMGMNLPILSPGPPHMYYSSVKNVTDPVKRAEKYESSLLKSWLDGLAARNMKGLVALYQGMEAASHSRNYEKTKVVVEDFKNHEAVAGWVVMDEPFDMLAEPEYWLASSYTLIRNIDDRNPVYFVDNSNEIAISSAFCDIVAVDPYPSYPKWNNASNPRYAEFPTCSNNPAAYAGETTAILRRTAERYGKSFMTLNPAFDYNGYYPKTSELRSFWYQAIFEGAHGAGWYSLNTDNGILVKAAAGDTTYKDYLEKFSAEEQLVAAELFGRNSRYPLFNVYESDQYAYKSVVKNGDLYMLVINRKAETQTVTVPLTSQNGLVSVWGTPTELYTVGESANPVQNGNTVTLTIPAANVCLFRISCAVANTALLAESSFTDLSGYDAETIEALYRAGVVDAAGERQFAPAQKITRGEFAKYLIRALDLECMTDRGQMAESFTDVSADADYYREVRVGRSMGIFRGLGDNTFSPDAEITGQEAHILCERALRAAFKAGSEMPQLGSFDDSDSITRAEAAALLHILREI